jgi:hypothetical protein
VVAIADVDSRADCVNGRGTASDFRAHLQNQDASARTREIRRARETVMTPADDDCVPGQRASRSL